MEDFYVINEAECKRESAENSPHPQGGSPNRNVLDKITSLESENKDMKDKLCQTQEALAIVATAHEWCLSNKELLGWTSDQVERMREISNLMRNAVRVRDSCTRLIENERSGLRTQIEDLQFQLKTERTARFEAERKLSEVVKTQRPTGVRRTYHTKKQNDSRNETRPARQVAAHDSVTS